MSTKAKWAKRIASGSLFVASLTIAANAHADRRSSLAGNALISDQDDVYVFPQLTLKYRNMVSFDYYPGDSLQSVLGQGNSEGNDANALLPTDETEVIRSGQNSMGGGGLLLFGEENFAFGISSHREDVFGAAPNHYLGVGDLQLYGGSRNAAWGFLGPNGPTPGSLDATPGGDAASLSGAFLEPLQLADVLLGFGLDETSSLGVRLSIGQNSASVDLRAAGDVNTSDSWNTTAIGLNFGYSLDSDVKLDLGLDLGLAFFSNNDETNQQAPPNYSDSGSLAPSLSIHGRAAVPLRESVSLGVLGILHVNSSSITDQFGVDTNGNEDETESSALNFFFEFGAGPSYELPDKTIISAYATTGIGISSADLNDSAEEVSTTAILLPGFKLSLEHWLTEWFAFRSGLSSRYHFTFQTRNFEDNNTPNQELSASYYEFLWSVGVGFDFGNFELNGTFQTPFITNGPHFLSGNESGLFALLNATYKF